MKTQKIFFCIILALSLLLCSCAKKAEYADGVSCEDIAAYLSKTELDDDEYAEYDREYFEYFFPDAKVPEDFKIIYSTDTGDIDEIGIFHTNSEAEANELSSATEAYIEEMRETQRAFIASYAPEELPKLDSAEVRTFGNYVVYAITDEDDKADIFLAVDNTLKK
ncbi:MAG: DUF4358 domain-containing protein [Clostridia bacterium]|nr:DUF4358 domain-containing protein [Clostridia bacterium]